MRFRLYHIMLIPCQLLLIMLQIKRLILDLHVLNTYVKKEKFKFGYYKVAKEYLVSNGFMYTFDLTFVPVVTIIFPLFLFTKHV